MYIIKSIQLYHLKSCFKNKCLILCRCLSQPLGFRLSDSPMDSLHLDIFLSKNNSSTESPPTLFCRNYLQKLKKKLPEKMFPAGELSSSPPLKIRKIIGLHSPPWLWGSKYQFCGGCLPFKVEFGWIWKSPIFTFTHPTGMVQWHGAHLVV